MRAPGGLILVIALVLAGCATVATGPAEATPPEGEYAGSGRAPSLLGAIRSAKMDAVRRAVVDLIGAANEQANRARLATELYETRDPDAYVVGESFETIRDERVGDDYLVEARVLVRMEAVAATLESLGLTGTAGAGVAADDAGTVALAAAAASGPSGAAAKLSVAGGAAAGTAAGEVSTASTGPAAGGVPTVASWTAADEERFIREHVEQRMSWMVTFVERDGADPSALRAAAGFAGEYLAENAIEAVDLSLVEDLRRDGRKTWKEETGGAIAIDRWIAGRLGADVYLSIDGTTAVTRSQNRWSAAASILISIFEASTGRLLGSVPWTSPAGAWQQTETAAVDSVLRASVYQAMPIAVRQAKAGLAAALREGIVYSLVLQRTADAKVVAAFRDRLKERVKSLRTVSQSDDVTAFEVRLVGTIEDLAGLAVSVAGTVPGLEDLRQVMLRGTSITFTTGR